VDKGNLYPGRALSIGWIEVAADDAIRTVGIEVPALGSVLVVMLFDSGGY
jgi:hypothetical protein